MVDRDQLWFIYAKLFSQFSQQDYQTQIPLEKRWTKMKTERDRSLTYFFILFYEF